MPHTASLLTRRVEQAKSTNGRSLCVAPTQ
jgi:hypothetical protein